MKYVYTLFLSLILSTSAFAGTKAYVKNTSGGKIVLTDETCPSDKTMLRTYKYNGRKEGHQTWEGCWKDDDLTIFVKWLEESRGQRYEKKKFKVVDRW